MVNGEKMLTHEPRPSSDDLYKVFMGILGERATSSTQLLRKTKLSTLLNQCKTTLLTQFGHCKTNTSNDLPNAN